MSLKKNFLYENHNETPFFSICIPQYNRTPFLLKSLEEMKKQTFQNFEVCISDDCSPDGRQEEVLQFLDKSKLRYRFFLRETNARYDGNLRTALSLAKGTYVLLMGNDDTFCENTALEKIHSELVKDEKIGLFLTNFKDFESKKEFLRVANTKIISGNVKTALRYFRDFSFVSGVGFKTNFANQISTTQWDGTEMYQIYLAVTLLSQEYNLLCCKEILIGRSIIINGEKVDSYLNKKPQDLNGFKKRALPIHLLGAMVVESIHKAAPYSDLQKNTWSVFKQLYFFTYLFWLFEYRKSFSWSYAAGFAYAFCPSFTLPKNLSLSVTTKLKCYFVYTVTSVVGLLIPSKLFWSTYHWWYQIAKRKS